jgi:ABC-type transporter Mla maintaining outer membrane lipid asymmetry ATPase subunit MlaF/ABC-type transporter Mla maintaining outer membrane lipid asymmetry permease subunit MlaE
MSQAPPPRLDVRGLRVVLPSGKVLIEDLSMSVRPGQVAVLLGGSGAGKSTFSRVLFEREELERAGFGVITESLVFDRGHLGLVPQRGALFDHLDVRGNLDLAVRYARDTGGPAVAPETWLERVGLPASLAARGHPVGSLSGGQAQRVAVARVLAGKRQLLFLDEPSVGLDPHRVRMLARLIREQVETLGLAAIVVTHDVALAAGVADHLYMLDTSTRRLDLMFEGEWPGPVEHPSITGEERGRWMVRLEQALVEHIGRGDTAPPLRDDADHRPPRLQWLRARAAPLIDPFSVCSAALARVPGQLLGRPRDFAAVARRVLTQTLLRPALFYAIVSVLIGYTVLYVISKVGGAGVRPDALIRQIGGSYVVALAPALTAILFVSASGSATNAWLGSMGLTKQVLAMEALGVDRRAYLWAPAWLALGLAFIAVACLFALGMIVGGMLLCSQYEVSGTWELLTADFLDPRPERARYAIRAGLLVWVYAWGIASDVVAKGGAPKAEADDVTRGMTSSVVASTLWMVSWELVTVMVVFNL